MLVNLVPARLRTFRARCGRCGIARAFPDSYWFEEPETAPAIHLPPELEHARDQFLSPPAVACCGCGDSVLVLPRVKVANYAAHLYGDESFSRDPGSPFFVYALVGAPEARMEQVTAEMRGLKLQLEPGREPESWGFHMKDIHSGDNRKKHEIFSAWDRSKQERAVRGLFELLQNEPTMLRYVITVRDADHETGRARAFQALLIYVVDSLASGNFRACLHFDADRDDAAPSLPGWAHTLYEQLLRTRLFHALSGGISLEAPRSIAPRSHPCSELADFVAFVVRRFHFERGRKSLSYPLENLGKVMWAEPNAAGDLVVRPQVGYPFEGAPTYG